MARSTNGVGNPIFGGYGVYEVMPYQVVGILTVVFALVLVIIGAVFPKLYEPLAMPQVADYENPDGGAGPSTQEDVEGAL